MQVSSTHMYHAVSLMRAKNVPTIEKMIPIEAISIGPDDNGEQCRRDRHGDRRRRP